MGLSCRFSLKPIHWYHFPSTRPSKNLWRTGEAKKPASRWNVGGGMTQIRRIVLTWELNQQNGHMLIWMIFTFHVAFLQISEDVGERLERATRDAISPRRTWCDLGIWLETWRPSAAVTVFEASWSEVELSAWSADTYHEDLSKHRILSIHAWNI